MNFLSSSWSRCSSLAGLLLLCVARATADPLAEPPACLKILLTNDDSYESPSINTLFNILKEDTCHDVVMVAPKEEQSGKGGSIEPFVPSEEGNPSEGIYFLDSFPINVVLYALDIVLPPLDFVPDLVISGPNEGNNIALSTISSGTVAGAAAAMSRGFPAVAVSASFFESEESPFYPQILEVIAGITLKLIETKIIKEDGSLIIEGGEGLNVNIPTISNIDGTFGAVDDYEFKLTSIGSANPIGGLKYFSDLAESETQQLFFEGALNGFPGLSLVIPYTDAGFPLDEDPLSDGNALGDLFGAFFSGQSLTTVTVSPFEFTYEAKATSAVEEAFAETPATLAPVVSTKSTKSSKSTKKSLKSSKSS